MSELSKRQQRILEALISEYIDSAEPAGSEYLVEKHRFDFSPATLRNEMATLNKLGYIEKEHASAGRIPTPQAFRYFIKNLMQPREMPVVNEVALKQRLWGQRHDQGQLLREAVHSLAQETQNLSLILTDEGKTYTCGAAHILRHPEFYDIDLTQTVLHMLDEFELMQAMFSQLQPSEEEFGIMLGPETGMQGLEHCGVVASQLNLPRGRIGYLGVFGPYRLDYPHVVPVVRYVTKLVNELSQSW